MIFGKVEHRTAPVLPTQRPSSKKRRPPNQPPPLLTTVSVMSSLPQPQTPQPQTPQQWYDLKRTIAAAEEAFYKEHPTQEYLGPRFVTVDADSPFPLPMQGAPPRAWERSPQGGVHTDGLTVLLGVLNEKLMDAAMAAKPQPEEMDALFGYDLWRYGSEFSREHSGRSSKAVEMCRSGSSKRQRNKYLQRRIAAAKNIEKRVRTVLERFGLVGDDHVSDLISYLRSVRGAPRQSFHSDFKKHRLFDKVKMHEGGLPYPVSVLLALQDGSTLTLMDGTTVSVPRGAVVVFKGNMIHAGSEWYQEQDNWRMHIYYGVRRGNEECMVPRAGTKRERGPTTTVIEPRRVDPDFGWCA